MASMGPTSQVSNMYNNAINNLQDYTRQAEGQINQGQQFLAPYTNAGTSAENIYMGLLNGSINPQAYLSQTPGYQFTKDQALSALGNKYSATGGYGGGAFDTDAMNYAGGLASNIYSQYMNQLQYPIGVGATTAGQQGNLAATGAGLLERSGEAGSNLMSQEGDEFASIQLYQDALKRSQSGGLLKTILGTAGMVGGAVLGGPMGAMIGGGVGNLVGYGVGGAPS